MALTDKVAGIVAAVAVASRANARTTPTHKPTTTAITATGADRRTIVTKRSFTHGHVGRHPVYYGT